MRSILVTKVTFTVVMLAVSDLALFYALPRESSLRAEKLPSADHYFFSLHAKARDMYAQTQPHTEDTVGAWDEAKGDQNVRLATRGHAADATPKRVLFPEDEDGATDDAHTLVFSTHIGEAVVSVGGLLTREGSSSRSVTVFGNAPGIPESSAYLSPYLSEDERAFKFLNGADARRWSLSGPSSPDDAARIALVAALTARIREEVNMAVLEVENAITAEDIEEDTGVRVICPRLEKDAAAAVLHEAFIKVVLSYRQKTVHVDFFEYESPLVAYTEDREAPGCALKPIAVELTDDQLKHKLLAVGEHKTLERLAPGLQEAVKQHATTTCGTEFPCEVLWKLDC